MDCMDGPVNPLKAYGTMIAYAIHDSVAKAKDMSPTRLKNNPASSSSSSIFGVQLRLLVVQTCFWFGKNIILIFFLENFVLTQNFVLHFWYQNGPIVAQKCF